MCRLIVNADDFGYCEAVNYGIISAHKNGIVTSTTMMANMPGFEHGIALLKENKNLGCGVHLTLSCNEPITPNLKTLVDENGKFHKRITPEVLATMDLDEVYMEFCAQIDKVKSEVNISHIDSHHHVHTLEGLQPVIEKIIKKYDLPIRGGFEYNSNCNKIVNLVDDFYGDKVKEDFFKENLDMLKEYKIVDVMTHPAYLDDYILKSTSYAINRTKEYKILTSKEVKSYVEENFELVSYNQL